MHSAGSRATSANGPEPTFAPPAVAAMRHSLSCRLTAGSQTLIVVARLWTDAATAQQNRP